MLGILVIDDPTAAVAHEPMRSRLLSGRAAPASAATLATVAVDPNREVDRLSAGYLNALGTRVVREVGGRAHRPVVVAV